MDLKKPGSLIDKYFKGNTSLAEERELKKRSKSSAEPEDLHNAYFRYLSEKSAEHPFGDDFDEKMMRLIEAQQPAHEPKTVSFKRWYLAASLVFVLGLAYLFKDTVIPPDLTVTAVETDTWQDPQVAFEETKKALLMLSANLNKGEDYVAEFSKFEQSQKNVKQN